MKMLTAIRYAAGVAGVAIALAGCSSGGSSSGLMGELTPGGVNPTSARFPGELNPTAEGAARAHFHPHRLWISPDVGKGAPRLLFLTDVASNDVIVYKMPSMFALGQITGFSFPFGECADTNGQIWIVDRDTKSITRWSRNLDMTRELRDHDGDPWSCAVDPTTGNLAVSNYSDGKGGAGNVVIYDHATGHGTPVSNPEQWNYHWLGYDTKGNLWVDGFSEAGNFILSSCSASSCRTVHITGGTIYGAGFVQWAVGQGSWYVADPYCGRTGDACVYPVSPSGALGTPINLQDHWGHRLCGMGFHQGVITNSKSAVLAAGFDNNLPGCVGETDAARWNFPAGGTPTHYNDRGLTLPVGAAISTKK